MNEKTIIADKDYFLTDDCKLVGPDHPLRRRLIGVQGQQVPAPFVKAHDLPREYDSVPVPETAPEAGQTLLTLPSEPVDVNAIVQEKLALILPGAIEAALTAMGVKHKATANAGSGS